MKLPALALAGVLVLGCAPRAAAVSPSPTASPPTFTLRSFSVELVYGDDTDRPVGEMLVAKLPAAWHIATWGGSTMKFSTETPDVYLVLGEEPPAHLAAGIQSAWFVLSPPLRFIYIHRGAPDPVLQAVHELGHAAGGCCFGASGAGPDGHWADCPTPPTEIMCYFQGSATAFSERELRAMGLSVP